MRGRYLILLVAEQSSLYNFTWSSDTLHFGAWNAAGEGSVRSIAIDLAPRGDEAD